MHPKLQGISERRKAVEIRQKQEMSAEEHCYQGEFGCWGTEWESHLAGEMSSTPIPLSSVKAVNKPQMRKVGFCSEMKDSASGGWCYHRGSDIQGSSYRLTLSSTCSMPFQQPLEAGFHLQSNGNQKYRHEHTNKIQHIYEESQNYASEAPGSTSG